MDRLKPRDSHSSAQDLFEKPYHQQVYVPIQWPSQVQPPVVPPDDGFDVVAVDGLVVVARVVGAAVLEGDGPAG